MSFLLPLYSQNLVPNPSFEDLTACPGALAGICSNNAPPWQCGTSGGSVDYYHSCATNPWVGVPNNRSACCAAGPILDEIPSHN